MCDFIHTAIDDRTIIAAQEQTSTASPSTFAQYYKIAIREKPKPFDTLYITTPDNEYESEQVRIMHRQRLTLKWKLKGLSPFEACIFLTSCIFHVRTSLVCKCSFPSNLKKNYHLFLLKSIFETWAGFIFSNQQYRCGSTNANDAKNISHVEQIHFL